jgi:hypothetical protein
MYFYGDCMKRVIAFILSLTYLVFISGTICSVEDPEDYSFASTFIFDHGSGTSQKEERKTSFLDKLNALKHYKVVKHLAGGSKTKVPRAGNTPAVFTNFVTHIDPYHYTQVVTITTPDLNPHPIFLKNSVLRI